VFEKAMTNQNTKVRQGMVFAFLISTNYLADAAPMLAQIIRSGPEYGIRSWAAIAVSNTGQHQDVVIPALLLGMKYPENDTRAFSARAFLHYPEKAREHIDAIRELGNDRDRVASFGARDVLNVIDPGWKREVD
jgi:hypothetical protein